MAADLVLVGGRIFTSERGDMFASAVAVEKGRISALGNDATDSIGPSTEVIDVEGGLVAPGFIDAHVHPAWSGLDRLRCSFDGAHDARDAVEAVAAYAREHPDEPWILGSGWSQAWFDRGCPSKELLDEVVSDRPVLVSNRDGHGAWVNSRALEVAGIDAHTPDPADGRIERNSDGSPQGTLHEGAVALVEDLAPPNTLNDVVRGLRRGQEEMLRYGITGWQDAIVDDLIQRAYLEEADGGRLIGRVVGALWWDRHRGLDQVDELLERRLLSAPGFSPISVKLMLDGVAENFTASMLDPWLDSDGRPTDNSGIDFIDPVELKEIVVVLDSHGFQCHFHAIGDGAVRNALDAVEEARARNGATDNRHHIAHIQVVHPDDVSRFAALDVIANAQPLWACNEEYQTDLTKPFLGPERSDWQYPFRSLMDAGARIGMGSDWGVSTANVMEEIDVAVTRTCAEGGPLVPDEALEPAQALRAFTMGSAYINHAERDSGSIAIGKLADFAVLDRDPLREGPFRDARVAMTIVGGRVVHEGGS